MADLSRCAPEWLTSPSPQKWAIVAECGTRLPSRNQAHAFLVGLPLSSVSVDRSAPARGGTE